MSVLKNAGLMSLAVFISRFLGLIREQVFAYYFGASLWADAYLVAFRIPNLFRDLFAEGALSSAFVSVFAKENDPTKAQDLYNKMLGFIFLVVGLLSIAIYLGASTWVQVLAPSYINDQPKYLITIQLVKLFSPFILAASAASLVMGVLNSRNVFFIPSMGAASFNLGNIVLGGALASYFAANGDSENALLGFGVGTLVGGFLQWIIQWPSLRKQGFSALGFVRLFRDQKTFLSLFSDSRVKRILVIMGPSVLTVAAVQINVMVNTLFATSLGTGAVSHLSYAFRLLHFPMGLFGVALSTASLPVLSKFVKEKQWNAFSNTLSDSMKWNLVLAFGAMGGLWTFSQSLIALLFEHGQFTRQDTLLTASVLGSYSLGLMAFNSVKVVTSAFYALESVWIPGFVSVLAIGLNYFLNSVLVHQFGTSGLALTTSLVSTINLVLLLVFLKFKYRITFLNKEFLQPVIVSLFSSYVLIAVFKDYLNINQLLMSIVADQNSVDFVVPQILRNRWGMAIMTVASCVVWAMLFVGQIALLDSQARAFVARVFQKLKTKLFRKV